MVMTEQPVVVQMWRRAWSGSVSTSTAQDRRWWPGARAVGRTGAVVAAVLAFGVAALVLFIDPIVNSMVKPRLLRAFAEAYPQYELQPGTLTIGIISNRVECDSLVVASRDTSWSARGGPIAVSGMDWWSLIWHRELTSAHLAAVVIEIRQGTLMLPGSDYEVHYDSLRVSVADSTFSISSLSMLPSHEDELFFASSPFRRTRLRMAVPRIEASGVAWLAPLNGGSYGARSIRCQDPTFDILLNKEKPFFKDPVGPMMPSELLSSTGNDVRIDSLVVTNGQLRYGERSGVRQQPGVISLDSVQIGVERVVTTADPADTVFVRASGRFMNAGEMTVAMVIPIGSPGLSYRFSGSLRRMGLQSLNAFLERAEHVRITGGVLHDATFAITVSGGRARGSVRAYYRDLAIAMIDGRTGSAEGIVNRIASFIGNKITMRGTNMPDGSGAAAIGAVRYDHRKGETFIEFSWFALRSGVGDVVGF